MGTAFASNAKAYNRWRRSLDVKAPAKALAGPALEQAIMNIAAIFPRNVIRSA